LGREIRLKGYASVLLLWRCRPLSKVLRDYLQAYNRFRNKTSLDKIDGLVKKKMVSERSPSRGVLYV
jgi:hypothetical protein